MSETTYTVTGMTCDHCIGAVIAEVSNVRGVARVHVDLPTGQVRVVSSEPLDGGAVRAAIAEAGYEVMS